MAKEIFMPKLSSTMEVGTLLQWFKEEGDPVSVGEPIFEIMTDKINIEVESYEDGVLLKKYYQIDDEVPINSIIGYIGQKGESVPEQPPQNDSDSNENQPETDAADESISSESDVEVVEHEMGKVRATPAARRMAREHQLTLVDIKGTGPNQRIHAADVEAFLENEQSSKRATPLAKSIATDKGINLDEIQGTGANGKIRKADLERQSNESVVNEGKRQKLSGIRKVVAERMAESAFTAPHVTLHTEVDMSKSIELRKALLGKIETATGYRLSYTEILIKAMAHTLMSHPQMNTNLVNNEIVQFDEAHIGLAVALPDGLVVPVIKNASTLSLTNLVTESKEIVKMARDKKLKPDQMTGGTMTISNLGMYAIDNFTPIINKPETSILGVGRINEKPVGIDGQIVLRPMMSLSLSFDHRVVDGAPAAAFLTDLKSTLENPLQLLL